MKTALCIIILFGSLPAIGQSVQRPVLIGIDVAKPVLSLVTPDRPQFRLAEATVKIPIAKGRYLSIMGGYGSLNSDAVSRTVLINAQGGYAKLGTEKIHPDGLVTGWHGLVSSVHEQGALLFKGPVFGDYSEPTFTRQRVSVGFEGHLGYQRTLSNHLIFRVSGRVGMAGLFGNRVDDIKAVFVPGLGYVIGDPVVVGFGLGLHLFFRTNPRPVAVSLP